MSMLGLTTPPQRWPWTSDMTEQQCTNTLFYAIFIGLKDVRQSHCSLESRRWEVADLILVQDWRAVECVADTDAHADRLLVGVNNIPVNYICLHARC